MMNTDAMDDPAPNMEMSTKEAAACLSGPVGYTINEDHVQPEGTKPRSTDGLRVCGWFPVWVLVR